MDHHHLGMTVDGSRRGVDVGLAEAAREGQMVVDFEGLVAEEEHQMVGPGLLNLREGLVVALRELHPAYFCADERRDGLHLDVPISHESLLSRVLP